MGGMIFRIMIEIFKGKVTVKSAYFYTTDTIDAKACALGFVRSSSLANNCNSPDSRFLKSKYLLYNVP